VEDAQFFLKLLVAFLDLLKLNRAILKLLLVLRILVQNLPSVLILRLELLNKPLHFLALRVKLVLDV